MPPPRYVIPPGGTTIFEGSWRMTHKELMARTTTQASGSKSSSSSRRMRFRTPQNSVVRPSRIVSSSWLVHMRPADTDMLSDKCSACLNASACSSLKNCSAAACSPPFFEQCLKMVLRTAANSSSANFGGSAAL